MDEKIDAVAMTRAIRDAHYEALKDATPEERVRFYREKAQSLRGRLEGMPTDFERDPDREL